MEPMETKQPDVEEMTIPEDAQREPGQDSFRDAEDDIPQTTEVIK